MSAERSTSSTASGSVDPIAALFADAPPLLKIVELANLLRMSREGVRKWTVERRVASLKFPKAQGMVRVFRDDAHTLLVQSYGGAATPPADAVTTVEQLVAGLPERATVPEAASLLRMTPEGMRAWTKQGVVPALDMPGKVVILRSDLAHLLSQAYVPSSR